MFIGGILFFIRWNYSQRGTHCGIGVCVNYCDFLCGGEALICIHQLLFTIISTHRLLNSFNLPSPVALHRNQPLLADSHVHWHSPAGLQLLLAPHLSLTITQDLFCLSCLLTSPLSLVFTYHSHCHTYCLAALLAIFSPLSLSSRSQPDDSILSQSSYRSPVNL